MRRDQFLICILLAVFLLGAARAITTTATITIKNPSGTVVVNAAAMSCSFVSYSSPYSTEANVCGSGSSTTANRTNYSCTYTYSNNSVAGAWNATVQFTESGNNAYDSTIATVSDADTPPSGQVALDCTSPTTCASDPACTSNSSLEIVTGTLYTIVNTQLSQSASPASPQTYGTTVLFRCNYSLTSNNAPVTGATVYVNINGTNYAATYNATSGNYTYTNSTLPTGSNSWYCNATEPSSLLQVGSTQTYTINSISTALSQSASPASPQTYGTTVLFRCNYSLTSNNAPVTGATVYVNINGTNYAATYNATSGNYTYTNSTLLFGNNSWYCNASATNYQSQTGSTQTYNVTAPPLTYSSNSTSSTVAGASILHSLYWQSILGLSGYIFSFDNCTGKLVNSSWVSMLGTANWSNVTKVINSTVGCTIRWCVYANDTSNNWNTTSCTAPFTYVTIPLLLNYSSNSTNSTLNGTSILHSLYWQGNAGLSGYTFQFCNGTWNGTACAGGGASNWADSSCSYRRQLNLTKPFGTQNLTNFPVLIVLNSSRVNYSSTSATDIRFYDSDNATLLYKETELWNSSGTSYIWVKKPSLNNNTQDFIWAYYNCSNTNNDNKNNVWDSNYTMVLHLKETSGNHNDSTQYGNNGTPTGVTQGTAAYIDGGDAFSGSSSYITTSMALGSTETVEAWALWNSGASTEMLWCADHDNLGPDFFFYNGHLDLNTWDGDSDPLCTFTPTYGQWYYYAAVIASPSTATAYVNGTLCGSGTYKNPTSTSFYISSGAGYDWNGKIDEFRVSNTTRSASWLNASYLTESDQLITYGSEQPKGSGWANDTWAAFAGSPATGWSNVTKTITSTLGANVSWCVYANDTSNNWNTTSCTAPFTYVTTAPILNYSSNSTNSTLNGTSILHSLYWQGNAGLSGYTFQFCNGTWNGTACAGGGASNWWNSSWQRRIRFNISESTGINRTYEPIDTWINFTTKPLNSTKEIRVTQCNSQNSSPCTAETEIPSQVYNISTNQSANVVFEANVSPNSWRLYYVYYNYSSATQPTYTTDLIADNTTGWVNNTNYKLQWDLTNGRIANTVNILGTAWSVCTSYYPDNFDQSTTQPLIVTLPMNGSVFKDFHIVNGGASARIEDIYAYANTKWLKINYTTVASTRYLIISNNPGTYSFSCDNSTPTSTYSSQPMCTPKRYFSLNTSSTFWAVANLTVAPFSTAGVATYSNELVYTGDGGTAFSAGMLAYIFDTSISNYNATYYSLINPLSKSIGSEENYSASGWVNDTWVSMLGTANWSNVTKVVNSTVGATIAWCVYANDTFNDWNTTSCTAPFTYITTSPTSVSVSTDQTSYKACGAVFYRISLYDVNSKLVASSLSSIIVIDPNSNTASSTASSNGTGVYLGNYSLNSSSAMGAWLLKVTELSGVTAGKNFYTGAALCPLCGTNTTVCSSNYCSNSTTACTYPSSVSCNIPCIGSVCQSCSATCSAACSSCGTNSTACNPSCNGAYQNCSYASNPATCNFPCSGNGICGNCTPSCGTQTCTSCGTTTSSCPANTCQNISTLLTYSPSSCNNTCSGQGACNSCAPGNCNSSLTSCGTSSTACNPYCSGNSLCTYASNPATCNNTCSGGSCQNCTPSCGTATCSSCGTNSIACNPTCGSTGNNYICTYASNPATCSNTCSGTSCQSCTPSCGTQTCGTNCGTSSYCSGGSCTTCSAGTANCNQNSGDACEINTYTDANNCGSCGNSCGINYCLSQWCGSGTTYCFYPGECNYPCSGGSCGGSCDCGGSQCNSCGTTPCSGSPYCNGNSWCTYPSTCNNGCSGGGFCGSCSCTASCSTCGASNKCCAYYNGCIPNGQSCPG